VASTKTIERLVLTLLLVFNILAKIHTTSSFHMIVTTLEHVSQRKRSPQARCCIVDENTKLERARENTKREFW
jgi:hypothetical protein